MKKLKRILHRLLFPGTWVVLLSVPVAAGLLVYTFLVAEEDSPIAYPAYVISAYSLTVVCVNFIPLLKKWGRWVEQLPFMNRYRRDLPFKLKISLYLSLAINLLYAGVNAFSGIYYGSPWFGSLAAYYILLSLMRATLAWYSRKNGFEGNKAAQWKRYRRCGALLMVMNIALAGVVVLVVYQNESFQYAGSLIYIMAMYAFYTTVMAIVNLVRYRQFQSPVMSAARTVNLVAAMVSMLSLETAMLSQFGGGEDFRRMMTGATGWSVCTAVVGMGVFMMIHSSRQLKKMKSSHSETD